jgi:filamentous hemagglutinin family protein
MYPRLRNLLLATAALLALGASPAAAGPEGGTVVGGAATIQGQGGPAVIVNQSTSSAVINWNTFNIRANESVRFNQPSASSVALNRVTGGLGPSEIMGSLTANGRVFIINRDGILFGPGSVINTAGFLATTNDIKNADFMAGRYNFNIPGRPDASIVNQGRITASSGGFAALVAPGVRNSGTITATLGTVALASGNSFTLDMYGDKLITLAVGDSIANKVIDVATGKPLKSLVSNTKNGTLSANGGRVELTAAAARAVVDSVINTKGVIRADSIGRHNGMIVLNAATGGSKPAGAPAQTIKLAGTISVAGKHRGTTGGTILVSGEHIKLANAKIDASGRRGGGKVLIGGDWGGGHPDLSLVNNASAKLENFTIATATTVSVDANSTINASATGRGNGGKVVLWSDSQTTFAGTILARGGPESGGGGFVEVSSQQLLNYSGTTDTRAPNGKVGTLLLDPFDVSIIPNPSRGIPNVFNDKDLSKALESSNVIVTTGGAGSPGSQVGDITVEHGAHVAWSAATTLTLSAYHDVILQTGSRIENDGKGNLVLRADNSGTGSGIVSLVKGSVNFSDSAGTVSIFFNPSVNPAGSGLNSTSYLNPAENYSQFVSGKLTAYMLVNTAFDLQNVRNNPGGTYALGRDVKNVNNSIANFSPIPNFTGLFDGQNLTVSDVTINAPSDSKSVGLFDTIGRTSIVRNLNLTDVTVNGLSSQFVGTLAGTNAGTVSNVSVTGTMLVDSGSTWGVQVGQNLGTISNSSAAVSVTVIPSSGGNPSGGTTSNQPSPGDTTSSTASAGNTTINTASAGSTTINTASARSTTINTASLQPVTSLLPLSTEVLPSLSARQAAQQAQVIQNLGSTVQLTALSTAPVFDTIQGSIRLPPPQPSPPAPAGPQLSPSPAPAGQQQLPSGFDQRVIDVPPPTETRFIKDEVVLQIAGNITVQRLQATVASLGLTLLASENLAITGSTVARFRIGNGRSPTQIIRALAAIQLVAVAQPNYVYTLQQESAAPAPAARGDAAQQGDAGQYVLEKLQISDVHRIAKGANVPIAVIDSEIDATHPDLEGAVTQRFDAVGAPEKPHPHGTGMAGAIAAHQRLLGIAPGARLLAVHAFSSDAAKAESTTFNILKGIDWSVRQGARIINMSFAGPRDPSLGRALKAAYGKGVVLIAAAGNAGPKSPPLFPAAYPNVIAVTATDVDDKLFAGANRGKYISVAAPGVDILVPAPASSYQLTTGTSVAAAAVSGIVALLLERNPKLTPVDVRRILTASAKRLSLGERDDSFGSGLIDPLNALQLVEPHSVASSPQAAPTVQQQ